MQKTNTPNYNTPQSHITNFKNFVPGEELPQLKNLKRNFINSEDNTNNLPDNKKMHFNKVTKTMQNLSKDEIQDKIEAIEELEDIKENNSFDFMLKLRSNIMINLRDIDNYLKSEQDIDTQNQLIQIKSDLENIIHNIV